jgi:molybdopterin-guanine dinucleotide biosynthesis protein B
VEGFKRSGHPKIEVHRAANGKPFLWPEDPDIAGIASDFAPRPGAPPHVGLDDIECIVDMMLGAALPIEAVQARLSARGE